MEKTLIGAIRWDAWGTIDIGPQVRATLSLQRFHFRLPFYAEIIGNDNVFIPPYSQEIIDKEIALAKNAGIDYWAFCWYKHTVDGGLDSARLLYQTSEHKNDVKWCPILCVGGFDFDTDGPVLIEEMKQENFQKVCDGRPLVYMFGGDRRFADTLRKLCAEGGVKDPCIYYMGWGNVWEAARQIGADGVSCYANGAENGVLYAELAKRERKRWDHDRDEGKMPVIPTVTTGWDKRPRYFHPVTWEFKSTNSYPANYTYQATDSEIAQQLEAAVKWCKRNVENSPANSVIIYAWNENDEGGWIMPTLKEMEDYGHPVRLDAIKKILKKCNK